jgi:hypothetical protein
MYARKYGKKGAGEKTFQYVKGVGSAINNLPGISDVTDYVKGQAYKKNQSLEEMTGSASDYLIEQVSSRLVPSILSDVAKASDNVERTAKGSWNQLKAKIPGARQTLPEKKNIFGETTKTESAISTILFGSRVKTSKEDSIIKEISNASKEADKSINFTDWDKSSGKTLTQFKEKKGQGVFNKAKSEYGALLREKINKIINSSEYKKASPEDKVKLINNADSEATSQIYKRYGFKYKRD